MLTIREYHYMILIYVDAQGNFERIKLGRSSRTFRGMSPKTFSNLQCWSYDEPFLRKMSKKI